METKKLYDLFIQRRKKLNLLYQNKNKEGIALSKQHQIFGALSELDLMIEVLKLSVNTKKESKVDNQLNSTDKLNDFDLLMQMNLNQHNKQPLKTKSSLISTKKEGSIKEKFMSFIDKTF